MFKHIKLVKPEVDAKADWFKSGLLSLVTAKYQGSAEN
jgi:hypothetical protein